jgi:hypothetical protein
MISITCHHIQINPSAFLRLRSALPSALEMAKPNYSDHLPDMIRYIERFRYTRTKFVGFQGNIRYRGLSVVAEFGINSDYYIVLFKW